jgi:hypothetical protein
MAGTLADVVTAVRGGGTGSLFLPDLTNWHEWHFRRGTLPAAVRGLPLPAACRALGVPPWAPVRPWKVELNGVRARTIQAESERTLLWETAHGTLTSRWTLGPDGDWWQEEYPVKSSADLRAAMEVARARRYVLDPSALLPAAGEEAPVIELPMRPFSEIFHSFLGWSEGLMIFLEEPEVVGDMVEALEGALAEAEKEIARMPGALALAPDNLDAQFMTSSSFDEHLAPSYRRTAALLHSAGKLLVVHGGGPLRGLLAGLARAGVDCVEGVCGPPQSDATLTEARGMCGPGIALWGGIPQDALLSSTGPAAFEAAAASAFREARTDRRIIPGVADRVPPEALPERIEALSRMAEG